MNQQQARYNMEMCSLRDQLQESENTREALEREVIYFNILSIVKVRFLVTANYTVYPTVGVT